MSIQVLDGKTWFRKAWIAMEAKLPLEAGELRPSELASHIPGMEAWSIEESRRDAFARAPSAHTFAPGRMTRDEARDLVLYLETQGLGDSLDGAKSFLRMLPLEAA